MENANEPVVQSQESSASNENQTEVKAEHSPVDDYKRDMFKWKQKARDYEEKLKEIELKEEQEKGNYQGVISKLKEDLKAAKSELANDRYQFANSRLDEAIKTEALSRGIKNDENNNQLEAFMLLVDPNSKKAVEFTDGFNVKSEDVKNLVDDHLKRYGSLFAKRVDIADAPPSSKPINKPSNKFDISKASGDDVFKYILENKDKLK